MLNAALSGELDNVEFRKDPVFGFEVPLHCPDVPDRVFDPAVAWDDKADYNERYRALASRFIENFKKFKEGCPPEVIAAGPKR